MDTPMDTMQNATLLALAVAGLATQFMLWDMQKELNQAHRENRMLRASRVNGEDPCESEPLRMTEP